MVTSEMCVTTVWCSHVGNPLISNRDETVRSDVASTAASTPLIWNKNISHIESKRSTTNTLGLLSETTWKAGLYLNAGGGGVEIMYFLWLNWYKGQYIKNASRIRHRVAVPMPEVEVKDVRLHTEVKSAIFWPETCLITPWHSISHSHSVPWEWWQPHCMLASSSYNGHTLKWETHHQKQRTVPTTPQTDSSYNTRRLTVPTTPTDS